MIVFLWQGYSLFAKEKPLQHHIEGHLSDIAEEVVKIPLEPAEGIHIKNARNIQREGKSLFLISNNVLYRFHRNGKFICRISDPQEIIVAGYLINPAQQQLIVMGNTNDIFYYSYDGQLIDRKKLTSNLPDRRMLSMSVYKNKIWSVEEKQIDSNKPNSTTEIKREVIVYDTLFNKIDEYKLTQADLGRKQTLPVSFRPQLSISADTDNLYAYEPPFQPEYLLKDSLHLKRLKKGQNIVASEKEVLLFPLRFGKRMWISSYHHPAGSEQNYTFCYDTYNNESWQVKSGFIDNFYQTGSVARLEALDLQGEYYYFLKPSTLYIVKLKG